jgi:hypothetical protein
MNVRRSRRPWPQLWSGSAVALSTILGAVLFLLIGCGGSSEKTAASFRSAAPAPSTFSPPAPTYYTPSYTYESPTAEPTPYSSYDDSSSSSTTPSVASDSLPADCSTSDAGCDQARSACEEWNGYDEQDAVTDSRQAADINSRYGGFADDVAAGIQEPETLPDGGLPPSRIDVRNDCSRIQYGT